MSAFERITSPDSFRTASRESTTTVQRMVSSSSSRHVGARRADRIGVGTALQPRAFEDRFDGARRGHHNIRAQHRLSCIRLGVRIVPLGERAGVFWVPAPDTNVIELADAGKGFQVSLSLYATTEESEHATVGR